MVIDPFYGFELIPNPNEIRTPIPPLSTSELRSLQESSGRKEVGEIEARVLYFPKKESDEKRVLILSKDTAYHTAYLYASIKPIGSPSDYLLYSLQLVRAGASLVKPKDDDWMEVEAETPLPKKNSAKIFDIRFWIRNTREDLLACLQAEVKKETLLR